MTCGRTLSIGKDEVGRIYWKFHKAPNSLLVFVPGRPYSGERGKWHRFSNSESIASLIMSLGKDGAAKDLKRAFPSAAAMCKDGSWSNALWARHFPNAIKAMKESGDDSESGSDDEKGSKNDDIEEPVSRPWWMLSYRAAYHLTNLIIFPSHCHSLLRSTKKY